MNGKLPEQIETLYRSESRRILAMLIRLLGDFDLAEEALHDAFAAAVAQWPRDGLPANPRAWLVSAGRFKTIDSIRRRARFNTSLAKLATQLDSDTHEAPEPDDQGVEDDELRLIFTCCHPALSPDARVALTLREVCGLTTEEIAHAFLICLIYIEEKKVDALPKSELDALMEETLAYNEMLQQSGHFISTTGLKPAQTATTIRMRKGKVSITDGPFAETKEVLGGFYVIEARDLNEAIQLASKSPSLHVGSVEVRPIDELI